MCHRRSWLGVELQEESSPVEEAVGRIRAVSSGWSAVVATVAAVV